MKLQFQGIIEAGPGSRWQSQALNLGLCGTAPQVALQSMRFLLVSTLPESLFCLTRQEAWLCQLGRGPQSRAFPTGSYSFERHAKLSQTCTSKDQWHTANKSTANTKPWDVLECGQRGLADKVEFQIHHQWFSFVKYGNLRSKLPESLRFCGGTFQLPWGFII